MSGAFDEVLRSRRKRSAENAGLGDREPLSKRMSKLTIGHPIITVRQPLRNPPPSPAHAPPAEVLMDVDETKDRIFVRSLDDELSASDESEVEGEGMPLFPRDIGRLLRSQIPLALLRGISPAPLPAEAAAMQMVVYREPESLTVPLQLDSVRRAVTEARERFRDGQATAAVAAAAPATPTASGDVMEVDTAGPYSEADGDAMDLS